MSSSVAAEQTLQLVQGAARHEHLLVGAQHARRRAGRAPRAGTSRWPPCAARRPRPRSGHPVRIGRASSVLAARTTWRSASPTRRRSQRDRIGRRLRLHGVVVEASGRTANCERPPEIVTSSAGWLDSSTSTAPAGSERTMSATSRAGTTTAPSTIAADRDRQLDRQLEVGTGDRQLVTASSRRRPDEHRQRPRSAGRRPPSGGQRFGEDVTFATELHRAPFPTTR